MARHSLNTFASAGFTQLSEARDIFYELIEDFPHLDVIFKLRTVIPDPDMMLKNLRMFHFRRDQFQDVTENRQAFGRFLLLIGASQGLSEYLYRHPSQISQIFHDKPVNKPRSHQFRHQFIPSLHAPETIVKKQEAIRQLRITYRKILCHIALWDLLQKDPIVAVSEVSTLISELNDIVIQEALALAQKELDIPETFPISIVAMGKQGAREINYISDVDLIFVTDRTELSDHSTVSIATTLAKRVIAILSEVGPEPALWEIDTALRPEGKNGALVRTLESHLTYYDRWAESWEFQALLKARPIAGTTELGFRYQQGIAERVWQSSTRENFVDSVRTMRERVTDNLPNELIDRDIKLGPGGIRDIEFSVQLLQLVHGRVHPAVRAADTLGALRSLSRRGFIGRVEQSEFSRLYRILRVLEHRVQLSKMVRNHLMPDDDFHLRVLARATGFAQDAESMIAFWKDVQSRVRVIHEKLFYRPLLNTVAGLSAAEITLSDEEASARLKAIGFKDGNGALKHIAAMTAGVSRRAQIQRLLLPALLRWLSEGNDPDYGLLAFRRISDELGGTHWYLRMLRDSSGAAMHLAHILSTSRYVGDLLGQIPEAVAWLEDFSNLEPKTVPQLAAESITISLFGDTSMQLDRLKMLRRREILRMAMAWTLDRISIQTFGEALSNISEQFLISLFDIYEKEFLTDIDVAVIALGRFGSQEQSLGSDVDIIVTYRSTDPTAAKTLETLLKRLRDDSTDFLLPFIIDTDLRPEGRQGLRASSIETLKQYYASQAQIWEKQALLNARPIIGDEAFVSDVMQIIDEARYVSHLDDDDVMEIRHIKARVESERLPKAADPMRHLKLGRGSLSDIEWLIEYVQLLYAHRIPALKTVHTLKALPIVAECIGLSDEELNTLRDAWVLCSQLRNQNSIIFGKNNDVLPEDFLKLEQLAQSMTGKTGQGAWLEEQYLRKTRQSRSIFEEYFYETDPSTFPVNDPSTSS